ncbi:cactus-binding C-terminus of cactin protein-domain-containing protein [Lipomyces oligophaga]|uniref:cactus-binding C-terminus of cactin protein-domain-containing protein n=1 Tax=Lipomyces oligophaga TaxID=45792 RepID=UPI0034CFEF8D
MAALQSSRERERRRHDSNHLRPSQREAESSIDKSSDGRYRHSSSQGRRRSRSPTSRYSDRGHNRSHNRNHDQNKDVGRVNSRPSHNMTADEERWINGENEFALKQAKLGAKIRFRESRTRRADLFALNAFLYERYKLSSKGSGGVNDDDDFEMEYLRVPSLLDVFGELQINDVDGVVTEAKEYLRLETKRSLKEFWNVIIESCYTIKRSISKELNEDFMAVHEDVLKLLKDQDYEGLVKLKKNTEMLLEADEPADVTFWSHMKDELDYRISLAKLSELYNQTEYARLLAIEGNSDQESREDSVKAPLSINDFILQLDRLRQKSQEEASLLAISKHETPDTEYTGEQLFEQIASKINDNEEEFNVAEEVAVGKSEGTLKPRFTNRVQMGFDWNRYNQTHFSSENPPPKIVQGYKFNIYYPELQDSSKAPTYRIKRDENSRGHRRVASTADIVGDPSHVDTCIITFIAGPPYENVSFRIVDRDWNFSSRRDGGFKSSFDKGILQLHFQFKKIFYRK